MYRHNRMKQIALRLKAALWNMQGVVDEMLTIIEISERDEELERLNGTNQAEGGTERGV